MQICFSAGGGSKEKKNSLDVGALTKACSWYCPRRQKSLDEINASLNVDVINSVKVGDVSHQTGQ